MYSQTLTLVCVNLCCQCDEADGPVEEEQTLLVSSLSDFMDMVVCVKQVATPPREGRDSLQYASSLGVE